MRESSLNGLDENLNSTMTGDPGWSVHISGGLLFFGRQAVRCIGIDVWAQHVRRDLPIDGLANGDHRFGGRNFHLDCVKPAPDMHLANFRPRNS